MKRIGIMSTVVAALMSASSCQKDLGGLTYENVYILENGELVDAQNYEKVIPCEGGVFDIEFVTYGLERIENIKRADGIVMTMDEFSVPDEDDIYDIMGSADRPIKRYRQSVTVTAERNYGKKERVAVYTVETAGRNGYAADITVRQRSR